MRQALSPIEESKEPNIIVEEVNEEEKNTQFTSPRRDSLENKQITSRITAKLQKFTNFIRRSSQASVNSSELFPPENEQLRRSVILVGKAPLLDTEESEQDNLPSFGQSQKLIEPESRPTIGIDQVIYEPDSLPQLGELFSHTI